MFYPEDSLKKGGRFYLCWVADSWPLCFATITQRQLWSQDIRKICDDLLEVMNNESGRPANRFSLRLSSQLMRGLVRLYQKKVNILLSEICMINARVMKNSNKKYNIHETADEMERLLFPLLELPAPVRVPVPVLGPEPEEIVEQMIQQSGNAVTNIEDITLKEAAIPECQLPLNDGFGEENPNQALQLLQDRTLEQMLGATSAAGLSALEIPPELVGDSTLEARPRLGPGAQMERLSDMDLTMLRKSTAPPDLLPEEMDKDIPIPEIPPPDLPAPPEKDSLHDVSELLHSWALDQYLDTFLDPDQETSNLAALLMIPHLLGPVQIRKTKYSTAEVRESFIKHIDEERLLHEERQKRQDKNKSRGITVQPYVVVAGPLQNITARVLPLEPEIAPAPAPPAAAAPAPHDPVEEQLEELEAMEPQAKRRRKNKLIIDKNTQLSKEFLRSRIDNINVELRCEDFSEDIAELRVPADILLRRAARAGARFPSRMARALTRMFSRNLGFASAAPLAQREMELALAPLARRTRASPVLEKIPEEPPQPPEPPVLEPPQPLEQTVLDQSIAVPELANAIEGEDLALMPTQKLETASQKRTSQEDLSTSQVKRRRCGYVSFRLTQSQNLATQEPEIVEKENIPDNMQTIPLPQIEEQMFVPEIELHRPSDPNGKLASLLQEAGLADLPLRPEEPVQVTEERPRKSRRHRSESSETMLGSLDRTKVSLGDSEQTTDSKRFIRDQWGTEGTMVKILKMVKAETQPLNVNSLMSYGPMVPGYTRIIAARCFTSILKLKQHGFIKVRKDPESLEVLDIFLGPKFNI